MATNVSLAGALVSASMVVAAAAVSGGVAAADPNQDEQFLALLRAEQIPAIDNVPALIARAHDICGELDHGASFDAVLDEQINRAYEDNPALRLQSARVATTGVRFITAAVKVYCPSHQGQLP
ncbi:DUF732 domain-containing protein [Mycobacterium talmoniae]|uniref:DUF732 domain-containing protein n=1 Tax=Mycobacterium talmoniae TaxID=1858794 RepID=A0A1S1NNT0_9MYCO|nr:MULTISPECIES: DUF732 domain-containing protein [Mycobacterium]OHV06554.1 hypothetical protein BKN37_01995 [Mycobacterium talmoniae]PQM46188.1 hypothetical protein C1Y40_03651 [Mycobacterium talmoniae]